MTFEKNLKSNQTFKIPGKTFLVGEYAVLAGGSCLGLATAPYFEVRAASNAKLFHPESAAGRCHQVSHEFRNPYQVGGFGASTAEYIFSYFSQNNVSKDALAAFNNYLNLYKDTPELKPSGADLLTQLIGQVVHIDLSKSEPVYEQLQWSFSDLDFLIYSTGLKVKTHEHLKNLDRSICRSLVAPSEDAIRTFKSNNAEAFKDALAAWSKNLEQLGLTAEPVIQLKNHLQSKINSILVKPCGALGADVILILCKKSEKVQVKNQIQALAIAGLEFKADSQALSDGFLMIF